MADLNAIYQEFGLTGLIPHALRQGTRAYQLLIEKIRGGDRLFYLESHLSMPFVIVKDQTYQTFIFTNEELAGAKREELKANRYDTIMREIPAGEGRPALLRSFYDDGITHLCLDEAVSIPLRGLVPDLPRYDGYPSENHMLRNAALNGATAYYTQFVLAEMNNPVAEKHWAELMTKGKFLLMVQDAPAQDYPLLTITIQDKICALIYTDWRLVGYDFETPIPSGFIINFAELLELLQTNGIDAILFNSPTFHMLLDTEMLTAIQQINSSTVSNQQSLPINVGQKHSKTAYDQAPDDQWKTSDPTPDWLK